VSDYHSRIMNIPAGNPETVPYHFKKGHQNARHAAAEIATEADAEIESLRSRLAAVEANAAIGRLVRLKLTSGNEVPVERCTIFANEIGAHLAGSAPKGRVYTEADGDCPHGVPLWQHCSSCPAGATAARET
jgi:hypothetical protein